jgi:hypothetical protein
MKSEIYTEALLGMVERGKTPKEAVHALAKHLEARGMKGALQGLGSALKRREAAEKRRNEVAIEVAAHSQSAHAKKEAAEHLKDLGVDDVVIREDDTLIGGWRLVGKGVLVDNSFKKHLLSFYKQLTH